MTKLISNNKNTLTLTATTLLIATILMMSSAVNFSASATTIELDGDAREDKFNQLYRDDQDFKQIVDNYRKISAKDALTSSDWNQLEGLLDAINMKMDGKTLSKEAWTDYRPLFKDAIEGKKAITKLKSQPSVLADSSAVSALATLVDTDYMPALYQPTIDISGGSHSGHTHSGGNGFIKYFVKTFDQTVYGYTLPNKFIYEVSLVFADEDCFLLGSNSCDAAYDNQRLADWGRIKDIESFFIIADKTSGSVDRLSFLKVVLNKSGGGTKTADGAYTFIRTFDDLDHQVAQDSSWTYHSGKHMKIWVNTWNHAMTDVDTNPTLSDTLFQVWTYTKNTGARYNAENSESTMSYTGESLLQSP